MSQHFAIVRDKATGLPKFDDPSTAHPIQIGMMTRAERYALGLHSGPWGIGADGPVPLEQRGDDLYAMTDVRALGQVLTMTAEANSTVVHALSPRTDHKAGARIKGTLTVIAKEQNA